MANLGLPGKHVEAPKSAQIVPIVRKQNANRVFRQIGGLLVGNIDQRSPSTDPHARSSRAKVAAAAWVRPGVEQL